VTTPQELRQAARHARDEALGLRHLATRLAASHVHQLTPLSGSQTWVGPLASELQDRLLRCRAELMDAAVVLRVQAARLDQEAIDLDRAAARAELLTSAG
jgi:hypothetical protein